MLLVACALAQWWLDRWSLGVAFDAYLDWQRLAANAAVSVVAMLLVAAATRRMVWSILLVAGVQALVFVASWMKIGMLGVPVVLQDAYFIAGADASSLHLLGEYVSISWKVAFGIASALALFVALWRIEPAWCRKRGWPRAVALSVSALLLVSLHFAAWPWTTAWYGKEKVRPSALGLSQAALHGGLVASMVYYHDVQRHRAFPVDAAALRKAIASVGGLGDGAAHPNPRRPDVVVVLSESFMDPRVLRRMQDLPDPIPEVRAQIAAGNGGYMLAPTFGGGTVRTEFEVLTGMPVDAFPNVYYPYVDLNPRFLPGLVSAFEAHGYASFAVHGNSGAFWNRTNTYGAMGIDDFTTLRKLLERGGVRDGGWLSDRSMTDFVLAQLDKSQRPTIAVAISIESHGPYDKDYPVLSPAERAAIRVPGGMDAAGEREFRNYLYHLHDADRAFGQLLAGLRARNRPFVLLFFGDHLPALGQAYDRIGFTDGREAKVQPVPWVLVTSDGRRVPDYVRERGPVHAWQLPALAWQAAGVGSEPWFEFLSRVGERMDPAGAAADPAMLAGLEAGANARFAGSFPGDAASK